MDIFSEHVPHITGLFKPDGSRMTQAFKSGGGGSSVIATLFCHASVAALLTDSEQAACQDTLADLMHTQLPASKKKGRDTRHKADAPHDTVTSPQHEQVTQLCTTLVSTSRRASVITRDIVHSYSHTVIHSYIHTDIQTYSWCVFCPRAVTRDVWQSREHRAARY